MKKLAFREYVGDWIYYLTALTYAEIESCVKKIDKELHNSNSLSEMIQRSLTENVDKISNYIQKQPEHFFNALVLAVYDGDPQWREVKLDYGEGEIYKLGILELSGDEKIFPVDGQHRVEGIKLALNNGNRYSLEKETIPVIFIGHKNTQAGMQRTRRLFSTLNRYAKPVSLNDIIALDEDDTIAIATRYLIEHMPLFADRRLNNHKQKAIPEKDKIAFTNIISLYECNTVLLDYFLKDKEVKDNNGKKLKGKRKIDVYCRFRQPDEEIDDYINFVNSFWQSFSENINCIDEYLHINIADEPAAAFRNINGGNILFRPIGQRPFVLCCLALYAKIGDFAEVMTKMNMIEKEISIEPWKDIAWNSVSKRMIASSNGKLIEYLFKYFAGDNLLSALEIKKMLDSYRSFKKDEQSSDNEILTYLSNFRV